MSRLVVATHNSHKTDEIRDMLDRHFDEVIDLNAFSEISPAIEDGETFEDNSKIKALHAAKHLQDCSVLADDSGLEVDALGGSPGVYSARYAGESATDAENRAKLLSSMEGMTNRSGRFRCVLALASGDKVLHLASGAVEGTIATQERGENGFGYDSLFIPEGHEKTFGELSSETKHSMSHRACALGKMLQHLKP